MHWKTSSFLEIEFEIQGNEVYDVEGNDLPDEVAELIRKYIPADCECGDLAISYDVEGYYTPATWDDPAEGDDERTLDAVEVTPWGCTTEKMLRQDAEIVWGIYLDEINEMEIEWEEPE